MAIFSSDIVTSAISASITDTAVDVFIYDTSKDSDGGAWRKRTQHTSWYNETLGTATRGSRKEFPAVAVIVVETGQVTIYDGDDPDLPMWMVFNGTAGGATHNLLVSTGSFCLSALNGTVFMGALAIYVNFISEYSRGHRQAAGSLYWNGPYNGNIAERNAGKGSTRLGDKLILGGTVDVTMTVLPNAPVDSATGLPVPTIAVATDGGVSVIKDDGTVVDITSASGSNYNQSKAITITEENYLWWLGDYNAGSTYLRDSYAVSLDNFPSSDFTWNNSTDNVSAGTYYALTTNGEAGEIRIGPGNTWAWNHQERNALGGPAGLAIHKPNIGSETNSLIAAITSDYNTGYMHGSCEGAFLSDTDTTNVSATNLNLITNGNFSNGTTGWSNDATPTFTVSGGGVASVDRNGGGATGQCYQTITTEVGRTYTVGVLVSAMSNGFQVYADTGSTAMSQSAINSTGTHYWTFTATSTSTRLDFSAVQNGNGTASFDNITIFDGVADRSTNAKGLAVFGTVTKSAVATGAEVVGYGPFSSSNVLVQPYNSDLTFGTNDFSVIFWMNNSGTDVHQSLIGRDNREFAVDILDNTNYSRAFRIYSNNSSNSLQLMDSNTNPFPINTWSQICVNYTGGNTATVYVNGVFNKTGTLNYDIDDTSHGLNIGARNTSGSYAHGASGTQLALVRVSASAPSAEQIKKMYEDEKVLFQENAKATLYGSSDAVTALAYDEVTDLLHVGTSAGRSDFQGLRRINNTTTAVTTAISAHDEFIIEQ
jgi:hypothetical protein